MGRIKVNLASGNIFEKPLITCFKGTNGNYIVFDNETNGSMGLPIICIGRLEGTTVSKISDQTEWTSVKENLKTIIGGTELPYLSVPDTLSANDEFYTQLTLPIASFELLKSKYNVEEPVSETPTPVETPMDDVSPVGPTSPIDISPISVPEAPVMPSAPAEASAPVSEPVVVSNIPSEPVSVEPVSIEPVSIEPVSIEPVAVSLDSPAEPEPVSPVDLIVEPTVNPATPVEAPIPVEPTPVAVEEPVSIAEPTPAAFEPISPIEISPEIGGTPANNSVSDQELKDLKENFMKSCENMFDALVEKLKK